MHVQTLGKDHRSPVPPKCCGARTVGRGDENIFLDGKTCVVCLQVASAPLELFALPFQPLGMEFRCAF